MTAIPTISVEPEVQGTRTFRHVLSVIVRDPLSLASTIIIILFVLIAIFAYQVAPNPAEGAGKTNISQRMLAPSLEHPLGTDRLGRDMLSRVIVGSRPALMIPIGVVFFAILIGAPLGAIAGYKGGWIDEVIMRITDMFLAFPSLLLAMAITAALGRGMRNAAIALVISWWPWYTRLVRGVTISLRERYFIEAAQATGVRDSLIVLRHILPNTISPIIVQATVDLGTVILAMGGLGFLGLGTQPPSPDWGLMVAEGRDFVLNQWWISTFAGLAIFIVVLAFNLLGDTLRDIFDPEAVSMSALLEVRDLYLEFKTSRGRLKALNGITFDVQPGELFGLVGETGCGKTVTGLSILRLLSRSASISGGQVIFEGADLLGLSRGEIEALRGSRIAMIFQDPSTSLNPVFSIGSQIERVIRQHMHLGRKQAREKAASVLDAVGMPDVERILASYPHQLSGGMQQRVMIAMALSCNPHLLIADEPTTALDVTIQAQILKLLRDLQKKFDVSVILITHNLGVIAQTCDRLAVLYGGRVAESGSTVDIFTHAQHPYTKGLMNAIPRLGGRGQRMSTIPGTVPSNPGAMIGCTFAPRCEYRMPRCTVETPPLYDLGGGHCSACYLAEDKA